MAFSESLSSHSHLWESQSRSALFYLLFCYNIGSQKPPALDCHAKQPPSYTLSHSYMQVSLTCPIRHLSQSSQPIRGERQTVLWHEINLGPVQLKSLQLTHPCDLCCTDSGRGARINKELNSKETIQTDLDWRHDQRDCVSPFSAALAKGVRLFWCQIVLFKMFLLILQ